MISSGARDFALKRRVGHLATASAEAVPHVVAICFAIVDSRIFIAIDEKPKSGDPLQLKRLRNIAENGQVCMLVDRYDDDWSKLGWVMFRGRARIVATGGDHPQAIELLRERYPAYAGMDLEGRPMIEITVETVTSWGDLSG
ncbi:MAG: TIGR03668 family PPOX class F420-dependent oxidoreductase [Minwuia sp.]|uniref:TIGR03668 family PPOX class F420-dependent oxidoreductase n=1 Tax=Minwuia sp. TaxID=2493630 RepID=UPI003A851463